MHTRVGVIVEQQASDEAMLNAAYELLKKYDSNREVEPYKEYPEEFYVKQLLKNYKARSLADLAASNVDWKGGEEGGIDKNGLYFISTQNPDGEYDYWSLLYGPTAIAPDLFTQDEYMCGAFITPDGMLRESAEAHIGKSVVIFDCHS